MRVAGIKITNHALVRFLERCKNFDISPYKRKHDYQTVYQLKKSNVNLEEIAGELLDDELWGKLFEVDSADGVYDHNGYRVVVKDKTIITITKPELHRYNKKNKARCTCSYRELSKLISVKALKHQKNCKGRKL